MEKEKNEASKEQSSALEEIVKKQREGKLGSEDTDPETREDADEEEPWKSPQRKRPTSSSSSTA